MTQLCKDLKYLAQLRHCLGRALIQWAMLFSLRRV